MREKRIPTILAIFVLLMALFVGVFLIQKGQTLFLRAEPGITPDQLKITNITPSSFTVSWITEKKTSGFVKFGETTSMEETAPDDRDQISGSTGSFQTHYVTLKNLKPKTTYFFKIGSGGRFFDNSGKPYEITTATTILGSPPPSDIASGTVIQANGEAAEGAIVYLSLANATPQSALVRSSGTWVIPLNTALDTTLSAFVNYDRESHVEEIFVQGASLGTATAITTTKNDNPVPEITLGKTYDFRQNASLNSSQKEAETPNPPASKFSFSELPSAKETNNAPQLTIINPKENEKISTQKPEFLGTGPVNQTIQIVIESSPLTGTAKTDSQGNWKFTPPKDLEPGEHTIKIIFGDKTVSTKFTVLAAGESNLPAFTATPSATLTPTATPSSSRAPTPTLTLSPTSTRTATSRTAMPATGGGVPQTGYLTPTVLFFIMGLVFVLSGFIIERALAHAR